MGMDFPAGTMTASNPLMTHRMEEYWPDPDRFDPDRFTEAASAARPKFAYVPFGGGAHACLGVHQSYAQGKVFLATLLAKHRVIVREGFRPRWYYWPHTKPLNGMPVTLERLG